MKLPNVMSPVFANMGLQHAHSQKKIYIYIISGCNQKSPSASHSNSKRVLWVWATCKICMTHLVISGWCKSNRMAENNQQHASKCIPFRTAMAFNSLLAPYSQGSALLDESRACACSKLLKKPWVKSKWGEVCEWKLIENCGWSWKTMIEKCAKFWIGQLNRFAVPWLNIDFAWVETRHFCRYFFPDIQSPGRAAG